MSEVVRVAKAAGVGTVEARADSMSDAAMVRFENGYGADIIRGPYSYGGPEGFFEIAVLDKDDDLCYDTPVTDDVLGWQTEEQVADVLRRIAALPPEAE